MKISKTSVITAIVALAALGGGIGVWAYLHHQVQSHALVEVQAGVLYRCRQPDKLTPEDLSSRGITKVVNLRPKDDPGQKNSQAEFEREKADCAIAGVRFINIPIPGNPTEGQLKEFLRLARAKDGATLVHCAQGRNRTGYAVGAYRIVVDGWDADRALAEMLTFFEKADERDKAKAKAEEWGIFKKIQQHRAEWLSQTDPTGPATSSKPASKPEE